MDEKRWGQVGEGGTFYQWYVAHDDVEDAKAVTEGVGHASQIIDMDEGTVWIFHFWKQEWGIFGG